MATLFKRKRTAVINGRRVKKVSRRWYTRLTDANGKKRTIALFMDRVASQQKAALLQKTIELERAGVIDRFRKPRRTPLAEHLTDYRQALLDKGATKGHAMLTYNRVESVLQACKFVFLADVQPSRVQNHIAECKRAGLGARSCNHYLASLKAFFTWMARDQRTAENPLVHLKGFNTKKDIRRQRRALTLDEIDALLSATLRGPNHHNMTGKGRYMIYLLGLTTGLRAGELHSLTWRSLNLSESEPSVTVLAAYAKNGKEATLPLRQDVGEQFRHWFAYGDFSLDDEVFPGFNKAKGAAMLRQDLRAAGIAYEDEAGRYADFHSLRHTFISIVGKSGATAKEVQRLARHSTVALTLDVYTHLGLNDERRAVENLPELHRTDQDRRAAALKTGTDDRPVRLTENGQEQLTPKLTPFLTPTAFSGCNRSATIGNEPDDLGENGTAAKRVNDRQLDSGNDRLATVGMGKNCQTEAMNNGGGNGIRTRDLLHAMKKCPV